MKKIILFYLLLTVNTVRADILVARYDGTNWNVEEAYSGRGTISTSMVLDSRDDPHISFYEGDAKALRYVHYDGASWQSALVDADASESSYQTGIALTSGGDPRISYVRTGSNSEELRYASLVNGTWTTELVDGSPRVGNYSSLALDALDNPHISYFDSTNSNLKLAVKSGDAWSIETVDSAGLTGWGTSLKLFNGEERIAYGLGGTSRDLRFAARSGPSWSLETVDVTANVVTHNSLALDAFGHPYIAYLDLDQGSGINTNLKYAEWNPSTSSWDIALLDSGIASGFANSIVIGADGIPHISYVNSLGNGFLQIRYATRDDNDNWVTSVMHLVYGAVSSTSISLDSHGLPVIAFESYPIPEGSTFTLAAFGAIGLLIAARRSKWE